MVLHEFSDKNGYTLPHNFISEARTYHTLYRKIPKTWLLDIIGPWVIENKLWQVLENFMKIMQTENISKPH